MLVDKFNAARPRACCIIFLLLSLGCRDKQVLIDIPIVPIDVSLAQTKNLAGKVDIVNIVSLETSEASLLPGIDKFLIGDNCIVAVSLSQSLPGVYLFDREGHFLRTIGRKGNGPGEYLAISDVQLDDAGKKVYIHDRLKQNMMVFDLGGKMISSVHKEIWIDSFCKTSDGYWVYVPNDTPDSGYALLLLDNDFNRTKGKFFLQKAFFQTTMKSRFFEDGNGEWYFAYPFSNIIYRLTEGEPRPYLSIDFGVNTLPYGEIIKMSNKDAYEQMLSNNKYVGNIDDLIFCGETLRFSFSDVVLMGTMQTYSADYNRENGNTAIYNNRNRIFPADADGKYPLKEVSLSTPVAVCDNLWVYAVQPYSLVDEDMELLRERVSPQLSSNSNPLLFFVAQQ